MDMDFDAVVAWLRERLGRQVVVATQGDGAAVGNTGLSVAGPLLRREIFLPLPVHRSADGSAIQNRYG